MRPEDWQCAALRDPLPFEELSLQAQRAALAIMDFIDPLRKFMRDQNPGCADPLPDTLFRRRHKCSPKKFRVGIVGAGAAGLFTAMIFDHLNTEFDLNVDYEILEAQGTDRLGGRLFTYYFQQKGGEPDIGPHDYYDVGAMRFPDTGLMNRTFEFFEELGMTKHKAKSPRGIVSKGELVPYYFKGKNQPWLYNGVQKVFPDPAKKDPASAEVFQIPDIPASIKNQDADDIVHNAIKEFLDVYDTQGPKAFWDKIMKEADNYSVRQYLMQVKHFDFKTVQFLEALNDGDGRYNQAFTESVVESKTFDGKAEWYCIEGGSQQAASRMYNHIKEKDKVHFHKTVMGMSYVNNRNEIDVQVRGETGPRRYDAVFNSAPLGAMQRMQLEGLNLNWETKTAIRSLGYGASCKVGVRFRSLWWIKEFGIEGGQGKTDLPIRCCVYPSYNIKDDPNQAGVLLVSYSWSQEADRLGALIDRESPRGEGELKDVLLHDLARLHAKTGDDADYERIRNIIADNYLDHFAWDWSSSPYSVGAFAHFGPGQFSNLYHGITASDGKHVIIGEAASAHHGWVLGALDSAVRGVYQFLYSHSSESQAVNNALRAYNSNTIRKPFGPLPAEYERPHRSSKPDLGQIAPGAPVTAPMGTLARWQVFAEKERLQQERDHLKLVDLGRTMPMFDIGELLASA